MDPTRGELGNRQEYKKPRSKMGTQMAILSRWNKEGRESGNGTTRGGGGERIRGQGSRLGMGWGRSFGGSWGLVEKMLSTASGKRACSQEG